MNKDVLSFDPSIINFISSEDGRILRVEKKSSQLEYTQMLIAEEHLKKNKILLQGKILLRVAPVLAWNEDSYILTTEYCSGLNLEEALRSRNTDFNELISILDSFFSELKMNGFLWGDCAPRNMIFNKQQGVISLVDFERKLEVLTSPVTDNVFSRYVKNYSREEFSSFLLRSEQELLFSNFLIDDEDASLKVSDISSNRKKKLLKSIFGEKDSYGLDEINQVEDMMVSAATPFLINGNIFYPMDYLDRISSSLGQDFYVQLVSELVRLNEYDRYRKLKEL